MCFIGAALCGLIGAGITPNAPDGVMIDPNKGVGFILGGIAGLIAGIAGSIVWHRQLAGITGLEYAAPGLAALAGFIYLTLMGFRSGS